MKTFLVCYDKNGNSKLLIHHKEYDTWNFEDGSYYNNLKYPAVAAICGEFFDCEFDTDNHEIRVWVRLVPEENRCVIKLSMKEKQLMNEFYTHFKKYIGLSKQSFELLLNI